MAAFTNHRTCIFHSMNQTHLTTRRQVVHQLGDPKRYPVAPISWFTILRTNENSLAKMLEQFNLALSGTMFNTLTTLATYMFSMPDCINVQHISYDSEYGYSIVSCLTAHSPRNVPQEMECQAFFNVQHLHALSSERESVKIYDLATHHSMGMTLDEIVNHFADSQNVVWLNANQMDRIVVCKLHSDFVKHLHRHDESVAVSIDAPTPQTDHHLYEVLQNDNLPNNIRIARIILDKSTCYIVCFEES